MGREDTKKAIIDKALELFSKRGYDAVSVGEIAKAVGIKAPSLYNHYPSKQAIFEAIVEATATRYERDTDKADIHVQDVGRDAPEFTDITADELVKKVRWIFDYSMHDETIARFRRMMTIEQFRSPDFAELYTHRYVDRLVAYHAGIFRKLVEAGEIRDEDPDILALAYVSPIITLIGVCDRQPEKGEECAKKIEAHVRMFFRTYNIKRGNNQ